MYYICDGEPPNTTISFLLLPLKEHKLELIYLEHRNRHVFFLRSFCTSANGLSGPGLSAAGRARLPRAVPWRGAPLGALRGIGRRSLQRG